MPPRHAYWTIIFGNQPTAFRTHTQEELLPTFRQIQSKHPDAVMMWFAHGRLWKSPDEAREARMRRRATHPPRREDRPPTPGARPRGRDWRPGGNHKDPRDRFKVPRDVKRARFTAKARRDRLHPKPGAPSAPPRPRGGERGPRQARDGWRKKKDDE